MNKSLGASSHGVGVEKYYVRRPGGAFTPLARLVQDRPPLLYNTAVVHTCSDTVLILRSTSVTPTHVSDLDYNRSDAAAARQTCSIWRARAAGFHGLTGARTVTPRGRAVANARSFVANLFYYSVLGSCMAVNGYPMTFSKPTV